MEKNKVWLWRAIDGVLHRPFERELSTRRDSCSKKLIDRIDEGQCDFATDDWAGFYRLAPKNRHFPDKDLTFPIEAPNSDIRYRLARVIRRTQASSRSLGMVHASLKLTHYLQDDLVLQSYLHPLLSIFS